MQTSQEKSQADIARIDPCLTYKEQLGPSSLAVYRVEKDGIDHVLKTRDVPIDCFAAFSYGVEHVRREARALERAKEVPGVTHLIKSYTDHLGYLAILKEFFKGKNLWHVNPRVLSVDVEKKLENTIHHLHDLRIAGFEVKDTNVVVSDDRSDIRIIDLDGSIFSSNSEIFEIEKCNDLRSLEELFGKKPKRHNF